MVLGFVRFNLFFFCLKLFKLFCFVGTCVLPSLNTKLTSHWELQRFGACCCCRASLRSQQVLFSRKGSIWFSSSNLPLATSVSQLLAVTWVRKSEAFQHLTMTEAIQKQQEDAMSLVAGKLVTSGSVRLLEWQFAVVDLENAFAALQEAQQGSVPSEQCSGSALQIIV